MMRKVKYVLAFLAGSLYTSSWWGLLLGDPGNEWMILPILGVGFGSVFIVVASGISLTTHWSEDS